MPPFSVEKLYGGESFQNRHWSVATRASPKCGLRLRRSLLYHRRKKVATEWKQFVASAIGKPAEVANARKPLRQDVLQEAVQKFLAGQRHGALLVVVCVIFSSEERLSPNEVIAELILPRGNFPVSRAGSNSRCNTSLVA